MVKALKTKAPAALNAPGQWHRFMQPWFDAEAYQERINARVPPSKDGFPVIRLSWGQSVWDVEYGENMPRYWTRRKKLADSTKQYWTVPRWILEKRLEPEQYMPSWEASRNSIRDEAGNPVDKGDPPPNGYYVFAHLIADHESPDASGWPACCNRAYITDRSRCWGQYRQPGELELQLVSQAMRQMEADKYRDPYRPLTPAEFEEIQVMAGMQVERQAEADRQIAVEKAADFYGLPVSAIPENYGRRESGIIVPE